MTTEPVQSLIDDLVEDGMVLPEGWACSSIRDLFTINYGKSLPDRTRKSGTVPVYGSNGQVGHHNEILTQGPTIIIGRKGSFGAVNLSEVACWPIDTAYYVDAKDLDNSRLDFRFAFYLLQTLGLDRMDTSTAIPGLNREQVYDLRIALPSVSEQRRIVDKIEELQDRVDTARDRLADIPGILARFRQAVLAAACLGKLTEDWRERFDTAAKSTDDLDLPSNWNLIPLGKLSKLITSGSRGWASYYSTAGANFIRSQNISTDRLDLTDIAFVSLPQNSEGKRTRVCPGDLLLTITGANVGKCAIVDSDVGEAYVSQHVALIRPVASELTNYLHLFLIAEKAGRGQLLDLAYGAGKPGLNLDNLRSLSVPLPPSDEQKEIVWRVDALFKLADTIEARVKLATDRVEATTQAILAKAFRGELVPTEAEIARMGDLVAAA